MDSTPARSAQTRSGASRYGRGSARSARHRRPPTRLTTRQVIVIGAVAICLGLLAGGISLVLEVPILLIALPFVAIGGIAALALAWLRFEWFLLVLLAVRPLFDVPQLAGLGTSVAIGLLFVITSLVLLIRRVRAHQLVRPSALAIGTLCVLAAAGLSTLTSQFPTVSASATVRLSAAVLMFVVLEQLLRSGSVTRTQLLVAVGVSAALVSGYCLVGFGGAAMFYDDTKNILRLEGPFVHPSVLAKFAVILVIVLAGWLMARRGRARWLLLAALVPVVAILGLTYTRAAWAAALVGVLYLAARRDWRFVPAIAAVAVIGVLSVPALYDRVSDLWAGESVAAGVPENSMAWRIGYWQQLLPLARMSPVNGVGIDLIPLIGGEGLNAHNVWVQVYVEQGLVGILALCAMVIGFFLTLRRWASPVSGQGDGADAVAARIAIAVAISLFVQMQTENMLNETTTLWYAALVMACGYARPEEAAAGERVGLRELLWPRRGPVAGPPAQSSPDPI